MDTVVIYRGEDGDYYWHRKAENGQIVSDSGEGYRNAKDCREMAYNVNSEATFLDLVDEIDGHPV